MSCSQCENELIAFHFGDCESRDEIEAHLLDCPACVRAFLELKRAIETGDESEAPSAATRAAIRSAVRDIVAPPPRPWAWWERPAALAAAFAAVALASVFIRVVASGPGSMPRSIDEPPALIEPAP